MLLHVQLDGRPDRAGDRAQKLAATGIDGLFTFEGQHDVFLPLAAAAATTDVELMTNVAIALPRSPLHLAHTAYDLQLLSAGRFRLGLGSQIRPHIESRYGSTWSRPAARMRETVLAVRAILDAWQTQAAAGVPRRVHQAHVDDTGVQPRSQSVWNTADLPRCAGSADDAGRRRGGRRVAGDAVSFGAALPRANASRDRRRAAPGRAGRAPTSTSFRR